MRPECLYPLFAPATFLPGVGPRLGKLFERLAGAHAPAGTVATLTVTVDAHLPPATPRQPYRVRCRDATGFLHLVFKGNAG